MLVPLSWLKEYVDIDVTPEELEKKLFDGGFEVEERYQVGKDISNVVVGLVESCEPIPETHLHVCQVNAGEHGTMQICCGADSKQTGLPEYPRYRKRSIGDAGKTFKNAGNRLQRDGCGKRRLLCPRGSSGTLPALQRSLRI